MDLAAYAHAFVRTLAQALQLVERLENDPRLEAVELQPRWHHPVWLSGVSAAGVGSPPPPAPASLAVPLAATPDHSGLQGYLDAAPGGIGARAVWPRSGMGAGVAVVDIEDGWDFGHEDLREHAGGVIHPSNPWSYGDTDHGTAVLGIFSADHNNLGVDGIAPLATAMAASATWSGAKWNAAAAIQAAAARVGFGGVILLEMHAPGPRYGYRDRRDQRGFLPVEFWSVERAAIRTAVAGGAIVVEAAGNGAENLDDPLYRGLFDRNRVDSGAILVGAGGSGMGATRSLAPMSFTNHGRRVDVQGWGEAIATTGGTSSGYHDLSGLQAGSRCYTASFSGTSGASPIVVGCVALVQGALLARGRSPLRPHEMRDLLVRTGTPQTQPGSGLVGPLPDLERAFAELGL